MGSVGSVGRPPTQVVGPEPQMAWNARFMRLGANGGDVLDLSIVGYQFPDDDNPHKRYSWHMIQGRADTGSETWAFRWQALTCDEGPHLAAWLREVARVSALGEATPAEGPGRAFFTEPNLAFEVASYLRDAIVIKVELDLEFRAPSNKPNHFAGHPSILHISTSAAQLAAAASDWESDLRQYPDGLAVDN